MSLRQTIIETASGLASERGSAVSEYTEELRAGIAGGGVRAVAAKAQAQEFTSKLLKLVLYQELKSDFNFKKYDWISFFDDEKIEVGHGKQYIKNNLTGVDKYNANEFVPNDATLPSVDSQTISLYDSNTTLNKYGFRALKPLTILESEWLPYFISGKLIQFIEQQVALMKKSLYLYKYNAICKLIKDLVSDSDSNKVSKKINGKATNLLTCFVNEVFPAIENMQYFNNEFAKKSEKNQEYPNINNRDDILILMNRNTLNKFKNGALSNTLNNNLVNFNSIVPIENIIGVGANLDISDSNTNIKVKSEELIPENKILVINKNLIKYLWFVDVTDSQKFVQNLSIQHVSHLWGVCGALDWEGAFVYENEALKVLPLTTK